MDIEFIVGIALGFVLVGLGLHGTVQNFGLTGDKQFGAKSTERIITSLVMTVWGLTIVMATVVLYLILS